MSDYKETPEEIQIRERSESKNPYASVCPNRHLWSEGYRFGVSKETAPLKQRIQELELKLQKSDRMAEALDTIIKGDTGPLGIYKAETALNDYRGIK